VGIKLANISCINFSVIDETLVTFNMPLIRDICDQIEFFSIAKGFYYYCWQIEVQQDKKASVVMKEYGELEVKLHTLLILTPDGQFHAPTPLFLVLGGWVRQNLTYWRLLLRNVKAL
jgi:hypothetical protein